MERDFAQVTALQALAWLAAQDGLFEGFLAQSGASAAQLRAEAHSPAMQRAVLEYIMLDDAWVIECAAALGLAPLTLAMARDVLGGGDRMHWT